MGKFNIAVPEDRGATVEVYEPRQHPEQEEVILDRFELKPGEVRKDYEIRSATAAYRFLPLGDEALRELDKERAEREGIDYDATRYAPEAQKPREGYPVPTEELEAGAARQQEVEDLEKRNEAADARNDRRARRAVDGRADAEVKAGRETEQAETRRTRAGTDAKAKAKK